MVFKPNYDEMYVKLLPAFLSPKADKSAYHIHKQFSQIWICFKVENNVNPLHFLILQYLIKHNHVSCLEVLLMLNHDSHYNLRAKTFRFTFQFLTILYIHIAQGFCFIGHMLKLFYCHSLINPWNSVILNNKTKS